MGFNPAELRLAIGALSGALGLLLNWVRFGHLYDFPFLQTAQPHGLVMGRVVVYNFSLREQVLIPQTSPQKPFTGENSVLSAEGH